MSNQKGSLNLLIVVGVAVVVLAGVAFYTYNLSKQKTDYYKSLQQSAIDQKARFDDEASKSGQYTEKDGVVWSDVNNIVVAVNLFYAQTKRLPKNLDEIKTLEDLSYFQVGNNPFTNAPYGYVPKSDNSGFVVKGMQSDGTDYIQVIDFK